jgi:hypothetical protein
MAYIDYKNTVSTKINTKAIDNHLHSLKSTNYIFALAGALWP